MFSCFPARLPRHLVKYRPELTRHRCLCATRQLLSRKAYDERVVCFVVYEECVCVREQSDVLLSSLIETHTCAHCPTEADWLCKKRVEYRSLRVWKTPLRLILIDGAKRRLFALPSLSATGALVTAAPWTLFQYTRSWRPVLATLHGGRWFHPVFNCDWQKRPSTGTEPSFKSAVKPSASIYIYCVSSLNGVKHDQHRLTLKSSWIKCLKTSLLLASWISIIYIFLVSFTILCWDEQVFPFSQSDCWKWHPSHRMWIWLECNSHNAQLCTPRSQPSAASWIRL